MSRHTRTSDSGRRFLIGCVAAWSFSCQSALDDSPSTDRLEAIVIQGDDGLRCPADASVGSQKDYAKPGPYQVGMLDLTLQDRSRPVTANAKHSAEPFRSLVTSIFYPASGSATLFGPAPLASGGPFPMLMYSHGYGSNRNEANHLANRAASYGYIVVAVDFPFTNTNRLLVGESLDTSDIANQARDVSFLIDRLLAFSRDPLHILARGVDEARIGAVGVSMGGLTTLLVALHPKLLDRRVKAAAPIAPLSSFFLPGFYHVREIPLLFVHGDLDAFVDYELNGRRAFERAAPNAQLVSFAMGTHAAFAFQLDKDSLALMNALLAPADADPANADAFGCAVVGQTLRDDHDYVPPLGGPENFVSYDAVHEPILPCSADQYRHPGLDAIEQVELATRAVVAFFEAQFAKTPETREGGCSYLLHELPKQPPVTVE